MRRKAKEVTMHRAHLRRPPPEDGAICFSLSLSCVCVLTFPCEDYLERRKSRKEPPENNYIYIFVLCALACAHCITFSICSARLFRDLCFSAKCFVIYSLDVYELTPSMTSSTNALGFARIADSHLRPILNRCSLVGMR
jgi:hypothetical protein